MTNAYNLVTKIEGIRSLGKRRRKLEDDIKARLKVDTRMWIGFISLGIDSSGCLF
jgi:hypothetical protein